MNRGRTAAIMLVAAAVLLTHLWLADRVLADSRLGAGAGAEPRRIEVAFVRELAPAVVAPPAPRRPRPRRAAAPPAPAPAPSPSASASASAPEVLEATAAPPPDIAADASTSLAATDPATEAGASAPEAPPVAAAPAPPAFEWPPSTRLSYRLTGDFRGPVSGQAQVEWLREDTRYQVHLDVLIGPPFAPLMTRRLSSDGELGEQGLQPRRYDEETRIVLRDSRRATIRFEPGRIVLDSGEVPTLAGVQDSASQFVQMTWMFTLDPSLLRTGRTVELPLALPRRVGPWTYEVVGEEAVDTPAGPVATWRLRPRPESARPGELVAEAWFAPTLQYLPVPSSSARTAACRSTCASTGCRSRRRLSRHGEAGPADGARIVPLTSRGMAMDEALILTDVRGDGERRTGLVTLNRPKQLNALNDALMDQLGAALLAFDRDDGIGCIVVTGSEKAFAAGADIAAMATQTYMDAHRGDFITRNWETIRQVKKPVIAAVTGFALGGGCELAMMCDFIIAADTAKFGQPEIKIGIIPGAGGTQRLPRAVGKSKAMEMVLTGRMMDAAEAERAGLVSRVVPADKLLDEALATAALICSMSGPSVALAKECVNRAFEGGLSEGVGFERRIFHALFATEDQKEGMAAFLGKRRPAFKHR
jgi:enoyl-CoA hydratase